MRFSTWLFLYVAGLIELALRYRVSFGRGSAAIILLIPLLAVAIPRRFVLKAKFHPKLDRVLPWLGAILAFVCAIVFARITSLDFWDTQRFDLAWLCAGIGLGGWLAIQDDHDSQSETTDNWNIVNWLMVSVGWLLTLWHPTAMWLLIGPIAAMSLLQSRNTNMTERALPVTGLVSAGWVMFLIGLGVSKTWWDSDTMGALGTALWGLGVAAASLPKVRNVMLGYTLVWLALFPLLYVWLPIWMWAPGYGVLCGWAFQRTIMPWNQAITYVLLLGLLLSYALHSNLQIFGLLLWGAH
jgi:hypothetical protein